VELEEDTDEIDDVEEHIDSVNILSQLNKDFYEKLEAKKWQERKEAIDMLEGILSKALKIESGDYGDLVRALKKVRNYILLFILNPCIILFINMFISKKKKKLNHNIIWFEYISTIYLLTVLIF